MRKEQLKDIISSLPLNLCYEDIETIAKRLRMDPIAFYLMYNDYVIAKLRPDLANTLDEDIEPIEDWI